MLFKNEILKGIRDGKVTLAFRRWRRPTIQQGGTLLTAVGQLRIGTIRTIAPDSISETDARLAGYVSREALLAALNQRKDGEYYRIELGPLQSDPRLAMRETLPTKEELITLRNLLQQMDSRSRGAPWTLPILQLLSSHPGVRAGDLCGLVDLEIMPFKRQVRKLKNLGLTESLGTGYRLSPRGVALLNDLRGQKKDERTPKKRGS